MTWTRIPHRCTFPDCDGLAVWLDPDGEPRCTMHGPPTTKVER